MAANMYTTTPPVRPGSFGLAIAKMMSARRADKYRGDAYPEPAGAESTELVESGGRLV